MKRSKHSLRVTALLHAHSPRFEQASSVHRLGVLVEDAVLVCIDPRALSRHWTAGRNQDPKEVDSGLGCNADNSWKLYERQKKTSARAYPRFYSKEDLLAEFAIVACSWILRIVKSRTSSPF